MKRLILLVLVLGVLILAALLAPRLVDDPGYVMLELGRWRIEMSVLILVALVLLAWIALSLLSGLFRLPGRAVHRLRETRARRQLESGLLALSEGDWVRAEKDLLKAMEHRPHTAGYLAAARAAQGRADPVARDQWLALADGRFGRRHFVTNLARARLLAGEGRETEALPLLEDLHLRRPRHPGVLRSLLQTYQDLGRWRDVRLLAPALKRADIIDAGSAEELVVLAAARELEFCPDVTALNDSWKDLGRALRRQRTLVLAYARRAMSLGAGEQGADQLRALLSHEFDSEALRLFIHVDEGGRAARIADCERWLGAHPDNPDLQLALGRLYLDDHRYDKAQSLLEQAVRTRPDSEAYAALGRILDRSGSLEAAAQCYRNALRLKSGRGAEPLPPPADFS